MPTGQGATGATTPHGSTHKTPTKQGATDATTPKGSTPNGSIHAALVIVQKYHYKGGVKKARRAARKS